MIPSAIIAMARRQSSNTPTSIVTQEQAYDYLNIILADFWKDITDNNTGQDMYTWTYDFVANQKDYTIPAPVAAPLLANSVFGNQQLTKIGVKYTSQSSTYTPVSLQFIEGLLNLPDYYATGQLKSSPKAIASTTTITIFPTPTETVTNGLQIIGPRLHFPLSASTQDVEGVILVPSPRHYIMVEGLKYWFYGQRGTDFEQQRQAAKATYEAEKDRVINQMLDRMQESSETFIPDLSYLG